MQPSAWCSDDRKCQQSCIGTSHFSPRQLKDDAAIPHTPVANRLKLVHIDSSQILLNDNDKLARVDCARGQCLISTIVLLINRAVQVNH